MPVHDWTRVGVTEFASFRLSWLAAISSMLNQSHLPSSYYSMVQKRAFWASEEGEAVAETPVISKSNHPGLLSVHTHPPNIRYVDGATAWRTRYLDRVDIFRRDGDERVGFVEVMTPANQELKFIFKKIIDRLTESVQEGYHNLIIDIHLPGPCNPCGTHHAYWTRFNDVASSVSDDEPLGITSYRVNRLHGEGHPTAFGQLTAVGQNLPVMPLFLTSDEYINLPLQDTYDEAWRGVPARWKTVLEPPNTP